MPNIITKKFKIINAQNFVESFSSLGNNSLYLFLSKPSPWNLDEEIPSPVDNLGLEPSIWDNIISLKRVLPSNIINVVKRINWEAQTIYAEYSNEDENLLDKSFYVINKDLDVYKCIDNSGGAPSQVEPTGKSLSIFKTSDNYKWKYLYTVSTSDRLKFLTSNWMPVRTNPDVAAVAKDGAIENVKILNGGTNYSIYTKVLIEGNGTGANINAKQNLGVIYDFAYNNTGTGYRFASATLYDPEISGTSGNVKAIISPAGGHGYNPVQELGAHFIMLNIKSEYNEGYGDFPAGFKFRQLGLVKNPKAPSGYIANAATLSGLEGLTLASVNGSFSNNEFIEGQSSSANAYAVTSNVVSGNGYLRYIQSFDLTKNYKDFAIGETIIGKTSGATAVVANTFISEVSKYSGDVIYVENKSPLTRLIDQTDNLHLVLEF
jgi:hypothetical protein